MLKRFMFASLAFIGLIVPGAFALALLAAPAARPEPLQQAGCDRSLVDAAAGIAAMQTRVKGLAAASDPGNLQRHAALFSRTRKGTRSDRPVQEWAGTRTGPGPL